MVKYEKRMNEIKLRLKEIEGDAVKEDANLDALEKEAEELRTELTDAEKEMRRTTLLESVAQTGKVVRTFKTEEQGGIDSAEYRSAFFKNLQRKELNETETRAFTSAEGSGGAVIPTTTANMIIKKLKEEAPLLDEITLMNVTGQVKFVVEKDVADADIHKENAAITGATDTFTTVILNGYEIAKLVQISDTVSSMSIGAFEMWLVDMLVSKIAGKIGMFIVKGNGTSEPQGVDKAATWTAANSVTVAKTAALTTENVLSLLGLLGGGYAKNAKILMKRTTLFNDFMPLQNKQKNDIVNVIGDKFFVYGIEVLQDENVAEHEAILGDFKSVVANLSENIQVKSNFDINTNSYKYLGVGIFDSKVSNADAFVKLVKATA